MMKRYLRPILLVASLVAGALSIVQAQSVDYLKVNVPFDFIASNKALPAGTYDLRRVQDRDPNLLRMSNAQGESVLIYLAHSGSLATSNTRFVFAEQGEHFVLTSVRTPTEDCRLQDSGADRLRHEVVSEYSIRGSN
jgi:hypothetical protein